MRNSIKITSLAAAALLTAALGAKTNTVKADTTADNTQNTNQQNNQQSRISQTQVDQANSAAKQAQTDVQNAQTADTQAAGQVQQAQQQVTSAEQNKPNDANADKLQQAQQNVNDAQKDVSQAASQVKATQAQQTSAQKQVQTAQGDVTAAKTTANQAQASAAQAQNNASAKQQAVKQAQTNLANARQNAKDPNNPADEANEHMTLSDSYKNAVAKYSKQYADTWKQAEADGKAPYDAVSGLRSSDDFKNTMVKASADSWRLNKFTADDADKKIMLDADHLTQDQRTYLSQYAAGIINSVRKQVGATPVEVNSDAVAMAHQIALGYEKDGRDGSEYHDCNVINHVAKDYDLQTMPADANGNYPDSGGQGYEDMASDLLGGVHADEAGFPTKSAADDAIYDGDEHASDHHMNLAEAKYHIYEGLKQMLFYNTEWDHAFSLLAKDSYDENDLDGQPKQDYYRWDKTDNYHVTWKFGFDYSTLPNKGLLTMHFILVPSYYNNGTNFSDSKDLPSTVLKSADNSGISKAQDALAAAQAAATIAAKQAQDAQAQADSAKQDLANANSKLEAAESQLKAAASQLMLAKDKQQAANDKLAKAQSDFNAESAAFNAQDAQVKAWQDKVNSAKANLTKAQAAKSAADQALAKAKSDAQTKQALADKLAALKHAQDLANQAAHNKPTPADPTKGQSSQSHGNQGNTGKSDDSKTGNNPSTTNPSKPATGSQTGSKPSQGQTSGNTKQDQGKADTGKTSQSQGSSVATKDNGHASAVKPATGHKTSNNHFVSDSNQGLSLSYTTVADNSDDNAAVPADNNYAEIVSNGKRTVYAYESEVETMPSVADAFRYFAKSDLDKARVSAPAMVAVRSLIVYVLRDGKLIKSVIMVPANSKININALIKVDGVVYGRLAGTDMFVKVSDLR